MLHLTLAKPPELRASHSHIRLQASDQYLTMCHSSHFILSDMCVKFCYNQHNVLGGHSHLSSLNSNWYIAQMGKLSWNRLQIFQISIMLGCHYVISLIFLSSLRNTVLQARQLQVNFNYAVPRYTHVSGDCDVWPHQSRIQYLFKVDWGFSECIVKRTECAQRGHERI